MLTQAFEASVRHVPTRAGTPDIDNVVIIDLYGEINASAEAKMEEAYAQASRQNPTVALLNFEGVDYINSTGIALIVRLLTQARQAGCRLLAYGLSDHYIEIFHITRLDEFIEIYPDEASALAAIAVPA